MPIIETYRDIALLAAKWFKEVTSSDGSGHADLGRRIEQLVAQIDEKKMSSKDREVDEGK